MNSKRLEHVIFIAILVIFILAISAHAQHTTVTATVLDPIGQPYTNCIGTATFVGQNNTPGAGPYLLGGSTFQTVVAINCNSFAVFTASIADNNQIRPTPSQWRFTICAPVGLSVGSVPPPICFNATTTITGVSQDLTATLQAAAAPLPVNGGGGGGFTLLPKTVATLPSAVSNPGAMFRVTDGTSTSDCTVGGGSFTSVCFSNGTFWQSTGGSGGGGTPGGSSTQLQFNNSGVFGGLTAGPTGSPLTSGGSQIPTFASGITYATTTSFYWSQFLVTSLTGGTPGTVVLTPCPAGVDYTSGAGYQVYIADGANSEAVSVTSGSTGSGNCSITFTPFFSHTSYTIGSASSGIQETINVACGTSGVHPYYNTACNVTIPANGPVLSPFTAFSLNTYNVYGTIFFHSNQSVLNGYGVSLNCFGRGPCLQVGDFTGSLHYQKNVVQGITFRTPTDYSGIPAYAGVPITNTVAASGSATITTASAHGFRIGDIVAILFTDHTSYWGDSIVTSVPSSTTFTYATGATIATQATPGVVALEYAAILDNADSTHLNDILYDLGGENGHFNNFFDMWDDENATIDHFNNNAINLNANFNWAGSFVFAAGAHVSQQIAPVITLENSSITANGSNGVTIFNSNGCYIENTVIQASGLWQIFSSNDRGNFQGCTIKNLYPESGAQVNPPCTGSCPTGAKSPFPGLGVAGAIFGPSTGAASFRILGGTSVQGSFPTGGTGATPYSYYIVANDTTGSIQTSPMQVLNWLSTGSDSIPVKWPRIGNMGDTITYDVIRMTTPIGASTPPGVFPYTGGCPGGAGGTCGYVAVGLTQAAACSGGLVCSYTDNAATDCGSIGSPSTCAYTIKQGTYCGNNATSNPGHINFWPGALVSCNHSVTVDQEVGPIVGIGLFGAPLQVASQCLAYGVSGPGGYTVCVGSRLSENNSVRNQTATIMGDGGSTGGGMVLSKGRLNFPTSPFATFGPHHIITLIDSQPALTKATNTFRPLASVNDTWIGTDVTGETALNAGQLAMGAPISISQYIAGLGDGVTANWGEKLTATLKEFQPLVKMDLGFNIPGCTSGQTLSHNGTKFVCATPGVPIDPRTTTTETISNADRLQLVTFNNGGATAITGPALASNFAFAGLNIGAGLGTFTPASGLVNGNATQIIPSNWFCLHYVDNGNTYTKMPCMPTIQAFSGIGTNQAFGMNQATGAFSPITTPFAYTAPTIVSGFGTSPSITGSNTAAFRITVGSGGAAATGIIGLPTAANGWNCIANDLTTFSASVFLTRQTAAGTTSQVTLGVFQSSALSGLWATADVIEVNCFDF